MSVSAAATSMLSRLNRIGDDDMSKKRILIVDDEISITRLLRLNLEKTGDFEVREENFGSRAVALAREFKPHVILLDVMMPDMDGGEIAAQLQSDPILKSTRIIFLTAAVKKEELHAKGGVIGGFAYVAKPLDVKGVLHEIEKQLAAA